MGAESVGSRHVDVILHWVRKMGIVMKPSVTMHEECGVLRYIRNRDT